jgi:hypothetical protein
MYRRENYKRIIMIKMNQEVIVIKLREDKHYNKNCWRNYNIRQKKSHMIKKEIRSPAKMKNENSLKKSGKVYSDLSVALCVLLHISLEVAFSYFIFQILPDHLYSYSLRSERKDFDPQQGKNIFLLVSWCKLALVPIQPHI